MSKLRKIIAGVIIVSILVVNFPLQKASAATVTGVFSETSDVVAGANNWTTTGSLSASNDKLYLAYVMAKTTTGWSPAPTLTGAGLTWVHIATATNGSQANIAVFRALVTSGATSGTLTFDTDAGDDIFYPRIQVLEFDGVDTSGTNGSGAVAQSATGNGTGTSGSVAITPINADYVLTSGWHHSNSDAVTPRTSWTEVYESGNTGNGTAESQYYAVTDTAGDATWGASREWAGIVLEVKTADVPADAYDIGINLRQTSGYVTDATNETYLLAETYPQTRNGFTFGYTTLGGSTNVQVRDRSNTVDRRLAGTHFNSGTQDTTVRIDLPNTNPATVHLAIGDVSFAGSNKYVTVSDGNGELFSLGPITLTAGQHFDSTGAILSSANWPSSEVGVDITPTTDYILVTNFANSSTTLQHIRVTSEGTPPETDITPRVALRGELASLRSASISAGSSITAPTQLTNGSQNSSALTSLNTSSVSPNAGSVGVLSFYYFNKSGATDPTVSGNGYTWSKVTSTTMSGGRYFYVYIGNGTASPTTGAVTISMNGGETYDQSGWTYHSVPNVDLTNSWIVANTSSANDNPQTTQTINFPQAFQSGGVAWSSWARPGGSGTPASPDSGWTEIDDFASSGVVGLETQYQLASDTSGSVTWASSDRVMGAVFELKPSLTTITSGTRINIR